MSEFRDASWDYGLEPGESFEPEGWEDEPFDLTQPHVMTALGPIDPGALGFALHAQRLISRVDPSGLMDADFVLDDLAKAASELEGYAVTGGQALVDFASCEDPRNVSDLLFVAQRSPVHIVMSTSTFDRNDSREAGVQKLVREIREGIGQTGACAGLILITGIEQVDAAVAAHSLTGVPIVVRIPDHDGRLAVLDSLVSGGIDPAQVTAACLELLDDSSETNEVLELGCFGLFDTWASGDRSADAKRAEGIQRLAEDGFLQRLLISGDLSRRSRWLSYGGGPGFVYFIDEVPLLLMEAGMPAISVRSIFFENVATALTINP